MSDDDDVNDLDGKDLTIKEDPNQMSPSGCIYPILITYTARRGFFNRAFSGMGEGSLRGSIFSLTASAIGSGNQ